MLKFQNNNTTFSVNFEDFILIVFVIIDDLYKKYAPAAISHRIRISSAKLSDPEIITISICGELFGFDSENALFNYIDKNYRYLFPNLCSRSRFNRTRRNLLKLTNILFQKLQYIFNSFDSAYYIVDSFPLIIHFPCNRLSIFCFISTSTILLSLSVSLLSELTLLSLQTN